LLENKVLRRIFRPKKQEIIGGWRKLCHDKLHNLGSSPDIIKVIKPNRVLASA
jgi:hypothetical protein